MVKSKNIFFINVLPKILIVKINKLFLCNINVLTKRTKTKIRFKKKTKKKTALLTTSPKIINYYINYNKTLQYNCKIFYSSLKKLIYLLRNKLKWNFKKFRYLGKGYKVKKFNSLSKITFRLGKSHWTKLMFNKCLIQVKRTKKNAYCCISIKNKTFVNFKQLIKKIKGINRYTKRGLRLTRQLVKKRFGKISQQMALYK